MTTGRSLPRAVASSSVKRGLSQHLPDGVAVGIQGAGNVQDEQALGPEVSKPLLLKETGEGGREGRGGNETEGRGSRGREEVGEKGGRGRRG